MPEIEFEIEIPDYNANNGFVFSWEDNFKIEVKITDSNKVLVIANKDDLTGKKQVTDEDIKWFNQRTGIDVIGSGANPIVALSAITNGEIHGNQTAYNLSTGVGGVIKRVSKDSTGHIHAPYQWETHPDVPFANNPGVTFESVTGYDSAVVTTKVGGTPDHPHTVIYDSSCASKWFDTTINQCR